MKEKIRINYLSTWGAKCGIAEYSEFFVNALKAQDDTEIKIFQLSDTLFKNPFYYIKMALRAGRHCDIVHIQFQPSFFNILPVLFSYFPLLILGMKLLCRANIVITIHELGGRRDPGVKLNILLMELANLVIVHSTALHKELKALGINEERIVMIPHGTPIGLRQDTKDCKRNLNLADKKVLTIFGFIQPNKGHDILVKAIPHLPDNIVLLILGTARLKVHEKYIQQLKALSSKLNINERVIFLGFVQDQEMSALISATDVAVFPYKQIEISGALHRILGYKVPTVTSDLGYFEEIKNNYNCIEIFPVGDYLELSNIINELLTNKDRLKYLARKCERFIELTNWDIVTKLTVNKYLEVIAAHPSSIYDDSNQRERISWLKLNKIGKTLEVGCATGYVTNYVAADIGLDIRKDRTIVARIKYPHIEFILGNASDMPFKDNAFDTVMVPDILEHVPWQLAGQIVSECLRISSCVVLITLPNGDWSGYRSDRIIGAKNPEHIWPTTKCNVAKLLNGFNYKLDNTADNCFMLIQVRK